MAWKFRVDDIGKFDYFKGTSLFENHYSLVCIIKELLNTIEKQHLPSFLIDYVEYLDELMYSKDQDYFIKQIEKIKNSLI